MTVHTAVEARVLTPAPRDAWAEVLAADPHATAYQTPGWFDAALGVSGARDASRCYETEDGRRLVLPLLRRRPLPGVALDEAYPRGFGSGGLLATGGLRAADVRLVLTDLRRSRAASTRIKANHDAGPVWAAGLVPGVASSPRRVEVLDLEGGFGRVWSERFQSSARRAVRKAERSGLEVGLDTTGAAVGEFYDLYLSWTARRARENGLPPAVTTRLARRREPRRLVDAVASALGDGCRVWVARRDGEAVAAVITLVHGEHATYWRGYSRKDLAGPSRANNLLQKLAVEDACAAGCRWYSLGESGGVAALEHFKQTMGAVPRAGVDCSLERLPLRRIGESVHTAEQRAARVLLACSRAVRHTS